MVYLPNFVSCSTKKAKGFWLRGWELPTVKASTEIGKFKTKRGYKMGVKNCIIRERERKHRSRTCRDV